MSDYKTAVNLLRANRPQFRDAKIKETGFKFTNGTISNDPTDGAQPGYLWVHGYPRGANVQVIAGTSINPRIPKVLVWVGENHARQAVAFDVVTDDNAVNQWGASLPTIATNPSPIDTATQETPLSLLGGGRTLPIGTPSPGRFVFIEAFPEVGWPGGNVAVDSGDFPTNPNEFRWAVWRFPLAGRFTTAYAPTYALTTTVTASGLDAFKLTINDAAQLALDSGDIRGGAVSLAYNQTDLTADNSVWNNELRRNFVPEGVATSTLSVDDGSTTVDPATQISFDPTHFSVTDGGGGQAQIAFIGGGGLLAQTFYGYNTIGGSNVAMVTGTSYLKKITLSAPGLLVSIDAYIHQTSTSNVANLQSYISNDNAGVPGDALAPGAMFAAPTYFDFGSGNARWISLPVGVWLPAGDYWIAVAKPDANGVVNLYYDGSGADYTQTHGGKWAFSDGVSNGAPVNTGTPASTSNKYSVRASVVS